MDHSELCLRAEKWLRNAIGCGVTFDDRFQAATHNGEQPDAIGWRDGLSFLVEVKVSRADFLADRKKRFRNDPTLGMGDWRFYLCPPGMILPSELPEGWGLLYCHDKKVEKVHGVPNNTQYWMGRPFNGNKLPEMQLMYSALRRLKLRGRFHEIYYPLHATGTEQLATAEGADG
ncbi:hypothetical protein [Salinicola halophyticus]|uniref:hypothetical protein n=1 Tax=Salinicola halophyticus TaxID=1808881 RepID=UPI000DA10E7B|nr:hypothetical protein [Salinicola halophyticus]